MTLYIVFNWSSGDGHWDFCIHRSALCRIHFQKELLLGLSQSCHLSGSAGFRLFSMPPSSLCSRRSILFKSLFSPWDLPLPSFPVTLYCWFLIFCRNFSLVNDTDIFPIYLHFNLSDAFVVIFFLIQIISDHIDFIHLFYGCLHLSSSRYYPPCSNIIIFCLFILYWNPDVPFPCECGMVDVFYNDLRWNFCLFVFRAKVSL